MAPETLDNDDIKGNPKIDIWALGVLLYELFHKQTPFESPSVVKMHKLIQNGKIKFSDNMNPKAQDLIKLMLDQDYEKRPNINAVLHHSFFSD